MEEESGDASGLEHLESCNLKENDLNTKISILIRSELYSGISLILYDMKLKKNMQIGELSSFLLLRR